MKKNTIFGQLVHLLSRKEFQKIVMNHDGDKYTKTMNCWQQLMILLFAQIKGLVSLRDIDTAIKSRIDDWKAIGIDSSARSTLSDANSNRPSQIFEEMFYQFLSTCQRIAPKHSFPVSLPVFSHDSTLIPLCLSVFPWARYRKRKGAMKLHMLLDHDGYLPSFISMSEGKCHDVKAVKNEEFGFPALPPDSILTIDRGYVDYAWLHSLKTTGVIFVIRSKSTMAYRIVGQHEKPVKSRGIISDDIIEFVNYNEKKKYPDQLRRITYQYTDTKGKVEVITVITNNMELAASTIASLYKGRWEIEKFFRWIKQNLRIKSFLGISENAVMTQVWVAMILYVLLTFIKYQTKFTHSLTELMRMIREVLFDRKSIIEYLRMNWNQLIDFRGKSAQMSLL